MIEFLLYLSPAGKDIYNLISKKVRVVENSAICRTYDVYGFYQSDTKTMNVCTQKIKSTTSQISAYVDETIFHESVHVAQSCKSGDGFLVPFGISKSEMPLPSRKITDLNNSTSIGNGNKNQLRQIEHEAFWMEDKPSKVKYVLQKYCFR